MKIITITGLKNSKKMNLAKEWDSNENVSYIQPFTTSKKRPIGCIYMSKDNLKFKMAEEKPLSVIEVNGEFYCYFKSQLINDFNVIIADDEELLQLNHNFDGRVVTIWFEDPKGESSDRVGKLPKEEYDFIFNQGLDDPDEFLEVLAFQTELVE